jgi:hypothetical protein
LLGPAGCRAEFFRLEDLEKLAKGLVLLIAAS